MLSQRIRAGMSIILFPSYLAGLRIPVCPHSRTRSQVFAYKTRIACLVFALFHWDSLLFPSTLAHLSVSFLAMAQSRSQVVVTTCEIANALARERVCQSWTRATLKLPYNASTSVHGDVAMLKNDLHFEEPSSAWADGVRGLEF